MWNILSYIDFSKLIMPSQTFELQYANRRESRVKDNVHITNLNVPSTNDAVINLNQYVTAKDIPANQQKVIIHAVGNGEVFEQFDTDYQKLAQEQDGHIVVGFNFRNVQQSTGRVSSQEDWINDVIAVVDHYLNKGIQLNNICLVGNSLGAAIVTLAAAKLYQRESDSNQCPKLLNIRSFSNLSNEVVDSLIPYILESMPYLLPLRHLLRPFVTQGLYYSFGNLDAAAAYKLLPDHCKDYIVAIDDTLINQGARLHDELKDDSKAEAKKIKTMLQDSVPVIESQERDLSRLQAKLTKIRERKILYQARNPDGLRAHSAHLVFMKGKCKHMPATNGEEIYKNKIKRLLNNS